MTISVANTLYVGAQEQSVEDLCEAYKEWITFDEVFLCQSLLSAVQELVESPYEICFIDSDFSNEDVQSFFMDIGARALPFPTVILAVTPQVGEVFDKEHVMSLGYAGVVSLKATSQDRAVIQDLLYAARLAASAAQDLGKGVALAMSAIDRVAESLKRGSRHMLKLEMLARDFITHHPLYNEPDMEQYLDELMRGIEQAKPNEIVELDVPPEVFARKFPGLNERSYTGASHRVWLKLKEDFGIRHGEERKHNEYPPLPDRPPKKKHKSATQRLKEKFALLGTPLEELSEDTEPPKSK